MIDTRAKREALTKLLLPCWVQTIDPTGSVDRTAVLQLYTGLGAAIPQTSVAPVMTWEVYSTYRILTTVYTPKVMEIGVN